jgi:adenosylcobyric acid synthase
MAPEERALVQGLLINKFRGDQTLLEPALEFITQRTGVPVVGVIPHLGNLRIADEDSVALERPTTDNRPRLGGAGRRRTTVEDGTRDAQYATRLSPIDIAVVRLPHIANFDDFDALALEEGVQVRFVGAPDELRGADAIILPGTKTTIADLLFLNETGLAAAIGARARQGAAVAGICGGFQMLGCVVRDPLRVESPRDAIEGLGLLPVETVFEREKATEQVTARIAAECGFLQGIGGESIHGYEIHMGRTDGAAPMLRVIRRGENAADAGDGAVDETGRVFGTYLHGLFDNKNFRRAWLNSLRPHATSANSLIAVREREYERLAAAVRANVDMSLLRRMTGK